MGECQNKHQVRFQILTSGLSSYRRPLARLGLQVYERKRLKRNERSVFQVQGQEVCLPKQVLFFRLTPELLIYPPGDFSVPLKDRYMQASHYL